MSTAPTLLIAAHGTGSVTGRATIEAVAAAVRAARPGLGVRLCFLDVAAPSLRDALATSDGTPVVVVPLLLSAGYHVLTDIPDAVAGLPGVRVAAHLGPDPAVVSALVDRLAEARGDRVPGTTVLAAVGSSRPAARAEVALVADRLGERLGRPVSVVGVSDGLRAGLAAQPGPVEVAAYLLAEGDFLTSVQAAAAGLGPVAAPLGAHPALIDLVLARYDAAGSDAPGGHDPVR